MSEHQEQAALFGWATIMMQRHCPELELLFAVPNAGKRSRTAGHRLKREGLKPGVPDVWLPVARDGYHGLVIEMKHGRNKATVEQSWWLDKLRGQKWRTAICYGWDEARAMICEYMGIQGGGKL
jgi:hypothetical protein